MRKIKLAKLGQYVLLTRYSDKCMQDPWAIGRLTEVGQDLKGMYYRVMESNKTYRCCFRLTREEGTERLEVYKKLYGHQHTKEGK